GVITINTSVKGELSVSGAGPYSPVGTGKLVMVGGGFTNTTTGTYSELNLRNTGTTTIPIDIDLRRTGLADLNFPSAAVGVTVTMGGLKIGTGQILGVTQNNGTVAFTSVSLVGTGTFSPNTPGFGASGPAFLNLGSISETVAGSGVVINGVVANAVTL